MGHLLQRWTKGCGNCSENGWMEGPQFSEWFHKVFLKSVEHITEPKLLIVDGHKSHTTSIEVV
jgi:hypothetical protein